MKETMYDRIKRLRQEAGMSQETLAKAVGYSGRGMVSKIEQGKVDISGRMISEFARALGTTPHYLMDGEEEQQNERDWQLDLKLFGDNKPPDKYIEDLPKTEEARILSRGIDQLPEEQRKQAVAMFDLMFSKFIALKEKNENET